ncbi:hypothetical protein CDAR_54421 [Caerostris darwini]|uniref:Uncharacterized protein n=1 Tax=Caerostris darwini TaxID=1538125 RepID=A0AAV4QBZ6_9ARAC|nr:hypothetical protein CDAR_54421 [Caerostris darwini]
MQHDPNLSFYNQLPPTSQGIEDPSNYLTIYDSTNEYYNLSMNMQSGQSAMQDSDISRFQDKEYRSMAIARKSDRREENTKCASDLSITSINEQYHGNSRLQNSSHMAALKHVSTSTNTIMREKEFLNIRNSAYRNIDNIDSYSILHFGKGFLDSRQGRKEISHKYYKSQGQFADKMKFQNVFQCHFCGSYQRNLKDRKLPLNSSNVPFKCNECIETMKLKEKIQPCPKFAEVGDERSANKLQKKTKVLNKRFSCNLCSLNYLFYNIAASNLLAMNSDEIKYSTCTVVSLYRKFVSWWTVLDATCRILDSNFQCIVHYLEVNCKSRQNFRNLKKCVTYPLNAFINSTAMVKENLTSLTDEVLNLIELSSSNNPVSEEDLLDIYDVIHEYQEDLKENFMDCKKNFKDYCLVRQKILDCFEA